MHKQSSPAQTDFQPHPIGIHMLAIYVETLTGSISVDNLTVSKLECSHANLYQRHKLLHKAELILLDEVNLGGRGEGPAAKLQMPKGAKLHDC